MCATTLTEKIIARCADKLSLAPGTTEWIKPDLVLMYGWPGITDRYAKILAEKLMVKQIPLSKKCVLFIDHLVPPCGEKEADFHHQTRAWTKEQGIRLFEDLGIGHQVAAEQALVKPGELIVHFDMHVQVLGAFGALPLSLMADILTTLALGKIWIDVPGTIKVNLTGEFKPGVSGRDLIHKIIYDFGTDWAIGCVLEFTGDGASNMSIDDRMTLLSQVMFCGATSGVFPFDDKARKYLQKRGVSNFNPVYSDSDAQYSNIVRYDLSSIEPYVAAPPNPGNIKPISDLLGIKVHQGYIGSCAGGRLQELVEAAKILKGRKIKEGFKLYVVPSSREIMAQAIQNGSLGTLVEAGAFISSPSCDFCYGKTQSISAGDVAVSTGTLNVPGRMGSIQAKIYLTSAATVAACAIDGEISDPCKYL